jgi:hypothetical protein
MLQSRYRSGGAGHITDICSSECQHRKLLSTK